MHASQVLVQAGDWLLTFLAEINLTQQTYLPFLDVCSKVITTLSEESDRAGMPQREPALQTTQEYLRMMFNESVEDMRNSFKALIQLDLDASPPKGRRQQIQVGDGVGRGVGRENWGRGGERVLDDARHWDVL